MTGSALSPGTHGLEREGREIWGREEPGAHRELLLQAGPSRLQPEARLLSFKANIHVWRFVQQARIEWERQLQKHFTELKASETQTVTVTPVGFPRPLFVCLFV